MGTRRLITGASGFIGRYFVERFLTDGEQLTLVDRLPPSFPTGDARILIGDVRDAEVMRQALDGCDSVLHLAAAHHDFGISEATFFGVNDGATALLCELMAEAGINDLCFFSSVAVYGEAAPPHVEDAPTDPRTPYGRSKLAGEERVRAWVLGSPDRRALIIRPSVTFGPRNFANMFTLIRQIDRGLFFSVGTGDNIKSLSYVENLVAGTIALWSRPSLAPFTIINAVDKPDYTSSAIAALIASALGRSRSRLHLPLGVALALAMPFDLVIALTGRNLPISSARIRKFAAAHTQFEAEGLRRNGITPVVPLHEGIERMVRWYASEGRRLTPIRAVPPPLPFDDGYRARLSERASQIA